MLEQRRGWCIAGLVVAVILSGGSLAAQEVRLLAGGDIEWSRLPYRPTVAYLSDPGDWMAIPYLNLEENLDSIRVRIGRDELDQTYRELHYRVPQPGIEFASEEEEWRHSFRRTTELIRDADVAFANLEMPISDRAQVQQTASVGATGFADALGWAGFDVISLANNRLLDAETTGLLDTMDALDRAGVGWVGGGRDLEEARRPYIIERNGVRMAFLAYTYGVSWVGVDGFARPGGAGVMAMDPLLMREDIRRVRDEADVVILSFHWGVGARESKDIPEAARAFAREMIDEGADIILGHHAHVPKGVEVHNGGVIFYSLSNFSFGHTHDYFIDNFAARVTLTADGPRRVEVVPIAGLGLDVTQPYVLEGERAQRLLRDIRELSARLDTELTIEGDIGVITPR